MHSGTTRTQAKSLGAAASLGRRGARGQALIWFLGLIASLLVAGVGVYTIGQITSEKHKVTNATDAAAYSGALVQARALNLVAYGNRAEIANEAFLAQAMSLQSWVRYHQQVIDNVQTHVVPVLYYFAITAPIAAAIEGILAIIDPLVDSAEALVNGYASALPSFVDGYAFVLSQSSTLLLNGLALNQAAQEAADQVLAQNVAQQHGKIDSAAKSIKNGLTDLGRLNVDAWSGAFASYTKSKTVYNAGDGRYTAAEIVLASRDEFTEQRVGPPRGNPLSYVIGDRRFGNCWLVEIGSSRDGTTQLKDYERWEAQDTSEFVARSRLFNLRMRCRNLPGMGNLPTGWGRTTVDESGSSGDARLNPHGSAGSYAYNDSPVNHSNWGGIKALVDLDRNPNQFGRPVQMNKDEPTKTEFIFHYAAGKARDQVKTADQLGIFKESSASAQPLGDTKLKPLLMEDQVAALAAAKVFFARPKRQTLDFTGAGLFRSDAHHEVASLYSPYWQARLTQPSLEAFVVAYGVNAPYIVFSPGAPN